MLVEEAKWLAGLFSRSEPGALGPLLCIGSSTEEFRKHRQPHIDSLVFEPLVHRGISVIHTDIKPADDTTFVADIFDDGDLGRLKQLGARTILCSNVLEHVPCRAEFAKRLSALTPQDGTLIVTVPVSYPYHPDPIDTRFRPDVAELCSLFSELELQESEIVEGPTVLDELRRDPRLLPRRLLRSAMPFYRFYRWLSVIDRWRWLFRSYKATCVVLSRKAGCD